MQLNKKIIAAVILGVLSLALFAFAVFEIVKRINKNSLAFIEQKKELVLTENKIKDLENFEKEYKINKDGLEKIEKLFVAPDDPYNLINFLNFVRQTAENSGVSISVASPSQNDGSPWPYLIFGVSGKGKFLNFMRFLEKMENGPYLMEIPNISIASAQRAEKNPEPEQINFNLFLKTYVVLQKK